MCDRIPPIQGKSRDQLGFFFSPSRLMKNQNCVTLSPDVIGEACHLMHFDRAFDFAHPTIGAFRIPFSANLPSGYLPNSSTTKLPGTILGLGCGRSAVAGGGGPNSAVARNTW